MPEVVVRGRAEDILGVAVSASEGAVGVEDLKDLPLLRRGEIMETVPGLVVTQHSGDGKANQYFLRGFNLDHGTDFAFSVDDVPARCTPPAWPLTVRRTLVRSRCPVQWRRLPAKKSAGHPPPQSQARPQLRRPVRLGSWLSHATATILRPSIPSPPGVDAKKAKCG
jgi:hypothetical protein